MPRTSPYLPSSTIINLLQCVGLLFQYNPYTSILFQILHDNKVNG
jgi:hypothetical protein